ncbi:MAG: hypothetical protein RL069_179 [Planctomycetota bacterium]
MVDADRFASYDPADANGADLHMAQDTIWPTDHCDTEPSRIVCLVRLSRGFGSEETHRGVWNERYGVFTARHGEDW